MSGVRPDRLAAAAAGRAQGARAVGRRHAAVRGGADVLLPAHRRRHPGELRRRGTGVAGLGHAARQRAAARLVGHGRLVLHDRAARVRGRDGRRRVPPRSGPHLLRAYLHAARAARRLRRPRPGPRRGRPGPGAARGRGDPRAAADRPHPGAAREPGPRRHRGARARPAAAARLGPGRPGRARWWVPVAAGALLAWSIIGDPLIEVVGALPLFLACALRAGWIVWSRRAADARAPGARAARRRLVRRPVRAVARGRRRRVRPRRGGGELADQGAGRVQRRQSLVPPAVAARDRAAACRSPRKACSRCSAPTTRE